MAPILRRKWVRIALPALALVAGLLIGWLTIGWRLWPVQWTAALAPDLTSAEPKKYLDVVAESYALNRDASLAQERLATSDSEEQPGLLLDVETRVAHRLEKTENILVLGDDSHHGYGTWRTDSIIVIAIDRENAQAGIVSIPRDLYVDIPGYGQERINVADFIGEKRGYPGGGTALAGRVISETLGIPTQHYVRLNLNGVVKLVDALGGVTVTLDCPLYESEPVDEDGEEWVPWVLPTGDSFLDGADARRFVTYRRMTSDFSRSRRQQQLIWALRNRALEIDLIPRLPQLWTALSDLYTTDLSLVDVVKLAQFGMSLNPAHVHGLQFSMQALKEHITADGAWVLVVGDKARLEAEKETLFLGQPLEGLGKIETGEKCPRPPATQ